MKMLNSIKQFLSWFFNSRLKRWVFLYPPMGVVLLLAGCDFIVIHSASGRTFTSANDVPACETALVLGTSPRAHGGTNPFYQYRMNAALALWKAGKVKHIIVSGDNSTMTYDETTAMKNTLVAMGIPDSVITCDYAGFHTIDSVVRCKWIFGQDNIVIVSQKFHNQRAIFIARHFGINAVGLNAKDVPSHYPMHTNIREYLSRVKAVLDIYILQTLPHFLGPAVTL